MPRRICITIPCTTVAALDNLVYQAKRDGYTDTSRSSIINHLVEAAIPTVSAHMMEVDHDQR